jgi:hypothetical protein
MSAGDTEPSEAGDDDAAEGVEEGAGAEVDAGSDSFPLSEVPVGFATSLEEDSTTGTTEEGLGLEEG